jgi:ATP adenylyltransferase
MGKESDRMKQLWAPWRMAYIQPDSAPQEKGCVFCVRDRLGEDRDRLILARAAHAFVLMNKFPYTNGHLMVAPYRHSADIGDLTEPETLEMQRLTVLSRDVLKECLSPQGFNIGMNLGQVAGAGIRDHLHLHIVPRWSGDTNFMPVFSDVRVIPEHLEATYDRLMEAFAKHNPNP